VSDAIAVTGASGHLGANLVRMLLDAGHRVRVLVHHDTAAFQDLSVEQVRGDTLEASSLRKAFDGVDTVYHLAAVITFQEHKDTRAEAVNVTGTENVVAACESCRVRRLVHVSSIHAFRSPSDGAVIDESCALTEDPGAFPYDRSKVAGERAVHAAVDRGLRAVVVYPTAVLGPHDYRPSALGQVVLDLCLGRVPMLVQGGFNWVDARDVCQGAMAAARLAPPGERYLLGGHHCSVRALAQMVEEFSGTKAPTFSVPMALARLSTPFAALYARMTGGEPRFTPVSLSALCHHQQVSHAKASRELGYAPRPLRDTVRDTLAWFKETGRF
jgi:dihydroflavonol-4-reductase